MQNLHIGATKPKRSVESLIDDSAIDHEPETINFEIIEMKKAYNETYKSFNSKIQTLETELNKYKEKCKKLQEANYNLAHKFMDVDLKNTEHNQMKLYCEKMKRKVAYIEGKYLALKENRTLVNEGENNFNEVDRSNEKFSQTNQSVSKSQRNEAYKEISELISAKVKNFTKEIRLFAMTKDLQIKIQSFLEELIYITPISAIDGINLSGVNEKEGSHKLQIKDALPETVLLTQQKAWKDLSKSIEYGEKELSETSSTALKRKQNQFNYELSKKAGIRGRSPLNVPNTQQAENRVSQYRPSPKKSKIFRD